MDRETSQNVAASRQMQQQTSAIVGVLTRTGMARCIVHKEDVLSSHCHRFMSLLEASYLREMLTEQVHVQAKLCR